MQEVEPEERLPYPKLPIFDILPHPADVHRVFCTEVVGAYIEPLHQKTTVQGNELLSKNLLEERLYSAK